MSDSNSSNNRATVKAAIIGAIAAIIAAGIGLLKIDSTNAKADKAISSTPDNASKSMSHLRFDGLYIAMGSSPSPLFLRFYDDGIVMACPSNYSLGYCQRNCRELFSDIKQNSSASQGLYSLKTNQLIFSINSYDRVEKYYGYIDSFGLLQIKKLTEGAGLRVDDKYEFTFIKAL